MTSSTVARRLGLAVLVSVLASGVACGSSNGSNGSNRASSATSAPTPATDASGEANAAPTAVPNPAAAATTTIPLLTAPTATTSAEPNQITIQSFSYIGLDAAKADVTWSITNKDNVAHTVSADDRSFVWRVNPGQTTPFFMTLAPGSYPIHCDVHPDLMKGVLVVR